MVCFLEGQTFKAQVFGLDAFDSSLGAEQSLSPVIVLEGNRLAAAVRQVRNRDLIQAFAF